MIGENKFIIIPYHIASSKDNLNVTERRILYRILNSLQPLIKGKQLTRSYEVSLVSDLRTFMFTNIDFKKNLGDNNYQNFFDAVKSLSLKKIHSLRTDGTISSYTIIEEYKYSNHKFTITVHSEFINFFLDFSKGFRKIELEVIFNLRRTSSMKMYELIAKNIDYRNGNSIKNNLPLRYSIEKLRWILISDNKYVGRNSDFIRQVLVPAHRELNQSSPMTFAFKKYFAQGKIKGLVINVTITEENLSLELIEKEYEKNLSPRSFFQNNFLNSLKTKFNFSNKEIQNNINILNRLQAQKNSYEIIVEVLGMIDLYAVKNKQGFLIEHLKKRLYLKS